MGHGSTGYLHLRQAVGPLHHHRHGDRPVGQRYKVYSWLKSTYGKLRSRIVHKHYYQHGPIPHPQKIILLLLETSELSDCYLQRRLLSFSPLIAFSELVLKTLQGFST